MSRDEINERLHDEVATFAAIGREVDQEETIRMQNDVCPRPVLMNLAEYIQEERTKAQSQVLWNAALSHEDPRDLIFAYDLRALYNIFMIGYLAGQRGHTLSECGCLIERGVE